MMQSQTAHVQSEFQINYDNKNTLGVIKLCKHKKMCHVYTVKSVLHHGCIFDANLAAR